MQATHTPDSFRAVNLSPTLTDPEERRQTLADMRELTRNPPFDDELADSVIKALASGMGITAVGSTAGFPAYWVINHWRATVPSFDEMCVRASEAYAEKLAADVIDIADGVAIGHSDRSTADRALSISARQWAVKVLNRKKFDPAVKVTVSHGLVNADEASDAELARVALRGRSPALIDHETGGVDEADAG